MKKKDDATLLDHTVSRLVVAPFFVRTILKYISLAVIIIAFWSIYGTLYVKIEGKGILLSRIPTTQIIVKVDGNLGPYQVILGQEIKKGDLIATITQITNERKLIQYKDKLSELQQQYNFQKENSEIENIEQLFNLSQLINTQEEAVETLELQIANGVIRSPIDGKVTSILEYSGSYVKQGALLISIQGESIPNSPALIGYGFFLLNNGTQVKVGELVEIEIASVNATEFGTMLGVVRSVSPYPVVADLQLNKVLQRDLVPIISGSLLVFQAVVDPLLNSDDPTDYLWTSRKRPPTNFSSETVCKMHVITEEIRPIYFAFPVSDWKYHKAAVP